jgi:hypothetical protein
MPSSAERAISTGYVKTERLAGPLMLEISPFRTRHPRVPQAMNHRRLELWLLRVMGSVELGAFVAVVMPRAWMESAHEWLGMGAMPEGAVVDFTIRQASFTYGLHGILLWLLSLDIERYRPLVVFTGVSYAVAGPVFLAIDVSAGLPLFWSIAEGPGCFFFGVALLWVDWRGR